MTTPHRQRYQVLDSLRGISACMVVLFHFHTIGWVSNLAVVRNGWMFVDFFFVLSGFVIATAYRRRVADGLPIASFMWLRLGRIYPVHLCVTGLFLAVQLMLLAKGGGKAFRGDMSIGGLLASLTFTQNLIYSEGVTWNAPSWSIAVEMWTYLGFAMLFRWFGTARSLTMACAVVAAACCVYIAVYHAGTLDDVYVGAIFRCGYGFALGVIGAQVHPALRGKWSAWATMIELAALAAVGGFIAIVGATPLSMAAPPMFLGLILIFANEGGAVSQGLKTRLPLQLGSLSYSIYMIHLFVLYRVTGAMFAVQTGSRFSYLICRPDGPCDATGSPLLADGLIVPVLMIVLGAAWLLRHFVEVPCEQWAKDALAQRSATRLAAGREH